MPARAVKDAKTVAIARYIQALGTDTAADVATGMLWIALSRSIGRRFGGMRSRTGDAWMSPAALERVVRRIEDDLEVKPSSEALARTAGLSRSAFLRAFRGATGMTPSTYVMKRRMERSAAMLVGTEDSIAAIAHAVGFRSSTHFATTFLDWCGEAPTAFRRRNQASAATA